MYANSLSREFPVAVSRLIEVHEIHVYFVVRQLAVRLRVQMEQRLLQKLEPVDPHFGGAEGVTPHDHAYAIVVRIYLLDCRDYFVGRFHHAFEYDSCAASRFIEILRDTYRVCGYRFQRFAAVEILTSR